MSFDAITAEALRASGGMKWRKYHGALGAFIAEMDFGVPPAVAQALRDAVDAGLLGYSPPWLMRDLCAATSGWLRDRYDWPVPPDDVLPAADVLHAFEVTLRRLAPPDAKVVLMTPAYGPFFDVAAAAGREVLEVPMLRTGVRWEPDLDGLATAFRAGGGVLVLCHPHNPIGKVYSRAELAAIARVVDEHGARVFSDEIHAPLMYDGAQHMPYATISAAAARHAVTATAASKGFNLAGLKCAQLIVGNDADRAALAPLRQYIAHGCAGLGAVATVAAYRDGTDWLNEVLAYLDGNRRLLADLLPEAAPAVGMTYPDATYFSWLDVRALGLADPQAFFLDHAKVALTDGTTFGAVGTGHVRLNFAMPRPLLTEAIQSIGTATRSLTGLVQ